MRENARARGEGARFFRVPLTRDFSRVFQIRKSLPAGWGHVRELSQVLRVRLFNEPHCKKKKLLFGGTSQKKPN